ncbi:DUF3488 domain-containing protein [Kitasatospora sp. NBC_00374]|uniref:hypothetical protein n=1 Tax=Kitasatospora sp. NBC_00374 TaxID=2975964 RepID=UPI0030E1F788
MARRYGRSGGSGPGCVLLVLILVLYVMLGYLLSLPVLIPDALASQEPPLHATLPQLGILVALSYGAALGVDWSAGRGGRRRGPRWAVPLRAAVLAGLASLVAALVGTFLVPRVFGPDPGWALAADVQCAVVGAVARAWYKVVRGRARHTSRGRAAAVGAKPAPGEVWLALVPYRERDERSRHYCVILNARADHAEVLQITTKDKDGRPDHIRMGTDGWNRTGKPCWVEVGVAPRTVPYEDFLDDRAKGPCPPGTWRQIRRRQADLGPTRPPAGSSREAGVPAQRGPARRPGRWLGRLTGRSRV